MLPIQTCPLCSSSVDSYSINLDTKMTMCENIKCMYPFNTTDLGQFLENEHHLSNSDNETTLSTGKRQARPLNDEAVSSGNGKRQKYDTTFLTSPIKQTKNSFTLALPSKPTSSGTLQLASTSSIDTSDMTSQGHQSSDITMETMYSKQFDRILKELNQMDQTKTKRFTLGDVERLLQDEPFTDSTNSMASLDKMDQEIKSNNDDNANDSMVWLDNLFQEHINKHEQDCDMDMHSDHGSIIVTPKEEALDSMEEPVVWLNDMFQDESDTSVEIKYHPLQSNHGLDSLLGLSW